MNCNNDSCDSGRRSCPLAIIAAVLFVAALLSSCGPRQAPPGAAEAAPAGAATPDVPARLSADEFMARVRPGDQVVDVRTAGEYAGGHLQGALLADVNAPDFESRVSTLDRQQPTYLYCRSGNRSAVAAERMREMGFTHVVNVGGYRQLAGAGAVVARPGG